MGSIKDMGTESNRFREVDRFYTVTIYRAMIIIVSGIKREYINTE